MNSKIALIIEWRSEIFRNLHEYFLHPVLEGTYLSGYLY
jgi:hypothetical protein